MSAKDGPWSLTLTMESEALYRALVESALDPIFTSDASGRYLYVNHAAAAMLGRTPADVIGKTVDELFPADVAASYRAGVRHVMETGETLVADDRSEIDGQPYWFSSVVQPLRDRDGRIIAAHGVVRDITKLKLAEQALSETNERLQQAIHVSHIGIYEHDHIANRIYLSPEQREILGIDPNVELVLGREIAPGEKAIDITTLFHPDDAALVSAAVRRSHDPAGDGFFNVEYRQVRPDGEVRWVTTRAQTFFEGTGADRHPVRTVGASRDITEDKRAEEERLRLQRQLNQSQKMESVGRLAGGVAHDFNNMLNVILGYTDLSLDQIEPSHALHMPLSEIHAAALRSAGLTRQLLAFARRQTVAPRVLNINDVVGTSLTMLSRMIGEDVNLVLSAGPNLWPVRIDPSQIDQILANLAANARDAIRGIGTVTIATENVTLHARECAGQEGLVPGQYVRLSVTDTGSGMDADTQAHVFEPFYTTKPDGQGIGLGLATVYGIVRQNNGLIQVTSAVGKGTTVNVYLPRFVGDVPAPADDRERTPKTGHETILLVEDEPMVLDLSRRLLEKLGYRVLTAATPQQAITTAAAHGDAIDLLFTDVVMPSMSGPDLATQLVGLYPRLKCLFASGHFAQDARMKELAGPGKYFLQKPFSISELALKVREALEGR